MKMTTANDLGRDPEAGTAQSAMTRRQPRSHRRAAACAAAGVVALVGAIAIGGEARHSPTPLDPAVQAELAGWLNVHGLHPQRYVEGLFKKHDVVFLGEMHRIRHDPIFVQSLLAPLYESNVRVLALEFGRREDQPLIDWLVTRKQWDEALAREIVFRFLVGWGYQEYVDIYKAAWELNQRLPKGAKPLRVLAMNDSPDWSLVTTDADRDNAAVMSKVWRGGGEMHWAAVVLDAVAAGEKVLVYCGIHHAFTAYRQPVVYEGKSRGFGESRAGNHVFAAIGNRVATVFLHAPWRGYGGYDSPPRHPADGVIDALMLAIGPRPVGFDLNPGPFGEILVTDAVYRHGYDGFRLGQFCDGWIYTKPLSETEGVTPIPGWINEDNLERAQRQSPNPASRRMAADWFNQGIAGDAEIPRRWWQLR